MPLRLVIILAMAAALGPFALDTYLPAFPSIATSLNTGIDHIGLSVSVYIFGLAFGQLIGGPLSDRWGRAKIMLTGLIIFSIASLMLAFSHNLNELIVWRIIQALGGGWSGVSIAAIVRDRTDGQEAAKLFSMITLIMIIAPALAPTIGSTILTLGSWREIFIFLTVYSLLVLILLRIYIFTASASAQQTRVAKLSFFPAYKTVLKNNVAIYLIMLQGFSFSVMYVFLTNASFIYQQWFGVAKFTFAFLFACNIAMMALLGIINRILLRKLSPVLLLSLVVLLQMLAVLILVIIGFFHSHELGFFVPALMVAVGTIGVISPNNQACYLQAFKHNSGTAAALMGAFQLAIAGGMSALSAFMGNGTLRPIVLVMGLCSVLSILSLGRALTIIRNDRSKKTY